MSVRYATLSAASSGRGPKSAQLFPAMRRRTTVVSAASSYASVVVAIPAAAHTKGSWVQIVASSSANTSLIRFNAAGFFGGGTSFPALFDIGVGAAGSEVVVVPNVTFGGAGAIRVDIPIAIPAGSRIAVRGQSNRTSFNSSAQVTLVNTPDYATTPTSLTTMGANTATSAGTAMSGASGTYVQITASTAVDYQSLVLVSSVPGSTATTQAAAVHTLAIGAAGAEQDLSINPFSSDSGLGITTSLVGLYWSGGLIPAGSRISVKHNHTSNPQNFAACVIGVPYV